MKRIYVYIAMLLGLSLTSCNKWLDINTDPTSPSESQMTPAILMPGAEMNLASSYGDFLRIAGGYYVQYYAHQFGTSNYIDYSQFQQSATRSSSTYTQLTARAIKNLTTARDLALASGDNASALAATVYRAFAYQVLVDCYGEIPYTEALDPSNTAPKFDGGDVIYAGILAELDEAIAAVGSNTAAPVCTNFLMPGSTAGDWIKFANALKLRIMMRQSGVVNNQDAVRKLIEADDALPTEDIAFQNCWKDETGQMSPFYAEEVSTKFGSNQQNVVANLAIFGTMWNDDYQDPRYEKCFLKNNSGNYTGGLSGTNFSTSKTYNSTYWSRPNSTYDEPVYMLTLAETDFFKAEFYAKANEAANAEYYYEQAVMNSMFTYGVADPFGATESFLEQYPYDQANYKKCIGIAKWMALTGVNTFESYCEVRRLGYPAFDPEVKGSDMYKDTDESWAPNKYKPGTLYTPYKVFGQVGDNKMLARFPYPESSTSRNSNAPSFPGYTSPVFWAK